eukprot:6181797-Pleurochrysis_carterae.AAC.2
MPKLREANEELSAQPPSVMAEADIEHLSDPDGPYIQMVRLRGRGGGRTQCSRERRGAGRHGERANQ